jgi:prophage tail gpP-like protein
MPDDSVTMTIDGREWREFDEVELHLSIDNHATLGFTAPFEPERKAFRQTFKPFSFKPITLSVGGERLFTGTLIDVNPTTDPGKRTVACSAYSKAAVLEDCNPPIGFAPFEANGLTLMQISERMAGPFGVGVTMNGADGPPFKRVKTRQKRVDTTADQEQTIGDFLTELAKQRGYVKSSDAFGDLLYQRSVAPGNPVARLQEGVAPLASVVPTFNPQTYFSEITGFTSAKRGRVGAKYTERNARLSGGVLRSMSFKLDDIEKADAPVAVRNKIARMFASSLTVVANLPTWRDPQGALFRSNTTLMLQAPGAMIYEMTEFLIRDVYLKVSGKETTASLGCVLPGAFSGEQPEKLPWDEA